MFQFPEHFIYVLMQVTRDRTVAGLLLLLTFIFGKLILLIFPFNSLMHYESLNFGMVFTEVVISIVILTSLIW